MRGLTVSRGRDRGTHRQREDVGQLGEAVEHKGNDSKGDVCPHNAKRRNADKVAEELLLLDGQARVEDDGRQQIPARWRWLVAYRLISVLQKGTNTVC